MTARAPPPTHLGLLVSDIARLFRRSMDQRLSALGMTQAQWRAIARLARNEGATQAALAESLEIQPITLTRLVDRMEKAGWVERRRHPLDRRAVQLYLTARAQPILDEMHARASEALADATRGIPTVALKDLVETLEEVKRNLVAADSAAPQPNTTGARNGRRRPTEAGADR